MAKAKTTQRVSKAKKSKARKADEDSESVLDEEVLRLCRKVCSKSVRLRRQAIAQLQVLFEQMEDLRDELDSRL